METGLQRLFLALCLVWPGLSLAQDEELEDIVGPDEERRQINLRKLDTENFEVGAFYGLLSVEDFGSNDVYGLTAAYHINEYLFLQANYGQSDTRETSFELLSGAVELLTEDQRELTYYNAALGLNLFPGRVYVGKNWSFNTSFYVVGGVGNTDFGGQDNFTYHLGAGFRIYGTDWLALDLGVRNHVFDHEIFGREIDANNLETRISLSFFF